MNSFEFICIINLLTNRYRNSRHEYKSVIYSQIIHRKYSDCYSNIQILTNKLLFNMKIGVAEILQVTPEKERPVPIIDPKQVDSVATLCSRQNRRNPDLHYKFYVRRDYDNGLFYIYAKYKEACKK